MLVSPSRSLSVWVCVVRKKNPVHFLLQFNICATANPTEYHFKCEHYCLTLSIHFTCNGYSPSILKAYIMCRDRVWLKISKLPQEMNGQEITGSRKNKFKNALWVGCFCAFKSLIEKASNSHLSEKARRKRKLWLLL